MATKIQVLNPEYLNELKNGQSFALNPADVSTHLLGHAGDKQRLKFTIRLSNSYTLGAYNITGGDTITLSNGASFLDQDFYTGGTAYLSHINGNNWQFDILNISTDGTELTATNIVEYDDAGAPTGPVILPDGTYGTGTDRDILRSLVTSNGLVAKFGFVGNNDPVSFVSPLDNVIQAYKFDGLQPGGAPGPVITGSWDNALQGSNTGSMTCQFINVVADNGINKTAGTSTAVINSIQEFEVIQDFIIPEYEQGDFPNVQDQIAPDRLINSLKQVFEFEFRQSLSDPNQSQFGEYNTVLGNVKYFNENYIDIDNQYSVSDVVLTDTATGQTIDSINASSTTRVTCSVNSALGTFLTTDPVLLEHTYLPNGDQYGARTEVYQDVWLYETLRQEIDAAATSNSIISLFTATLDNANKIDLQFDITFTTAQQTQIQNGYNYALSIKCADSSLSSVLSDVSKQIIQANQYTLNTDIAGLASFPQSYFYTRPMVYPIVNPAERFTDVKAWIQDGILYDWTLNLDLVEGATLEALTARLVAFNTNDNTWFEFDNYDYDLGGQVVTAGPPSVQNLAIDKVRGYDLANGDKLNFVKLQTGTYSAPDQPYTGQTAFRATWQEWLSLPTADTVFYNPAEPNNNLNKKGSNYSLLNGYVVCILLDARIGKIVDGVNVITQYLNRSGNVELYDFGEQDGSPITWTGVIQTFDEVGADLGGQILSNQNTVIKGSFTPDIVVSDPSLYWGEVRIEPLNNPANNYFVLSTLEAGSDNNPLTAPTGSTYAKIDIVGGIVQVCAVVDYTLLPPGADWCATVRFGLIDQSVPVVPERHKQVFVDLDNNSDFVIFQMPETMGSSVLEDDIFQLLDSSGDIIWKAAPINLGSDKASWIPATSYADFNLLSSGVLAVQSNYYIYIEVNSVNYPTIFKEGLNITYTQLGVSISPTTLSLPFGSDFIDREQVIWMNKKASFALNSQTSNIQNVHYALRVEADSNDTYTDYPLGTNGTGLAALNAAIALLSDETKYGVHVNIETDDNNIGPSFPSTSIDYDVTYTDGTASDFETKQQVNFSSVDDQRDFKDNTISSLPGAFTTYLAPYNTQSGGSRWGAKLPLSMNTLFDIQNDNSFSVGVWFTMPTGGASQTFIALLEQSGSSHGGTPGTFQWALNNGITFQVIHNSGGGTNDGLNFFFMNDLVNVGDPNDNIALDKRMSYKWAPGHKYFAVVTYEPDKSGGFYLGGNLHLYVNGLKLTTQIRLQETIPTNGTSRTDGNDTRMGSPYQREITIDCALNSNLGVGGGALTYQFHGRSNPNGRQSQVIWDKALTEEEVFQAYKTGVTSNWPAPGNVIHDWDFANIDSINDQIPDLVGGAHFDLVTEDTGTTWSTAIADGAQINW